MGQPGDGWHGKVESVVSAFQDITQRKKIDAELEQYRHQLEQMVSQRTEELNTANTQLQVEIAERLRLEDMLRLRLEWLVLVNQVNQTISNTRELPQVYQSFTDMFKNLFGATDALLAELDTHSKGLKLLSHSCRNDAHPDLIGSMLPFPSAALLDQLLEKGLSVTVLREQISSLDGPLGAHFRETQSQILVLVPLHCQENIIGLLGWSS